MTTSVQVLHYKARRLTLQLANGQVGEQGMTAIGDPATGTVKAGPSLSTGLMLGIFHAKADASGGQVPCDIDLLDEVEILFRDNDGSIEAADIFNPCYVVDATKVGLVATSRALAGTILIVDDVDGVGFAVGRAFLENT